MLIMEIRTTPEITSSDNKADIDLYKFAILTDDSARIKELLDRGCHLKRNNSEILSYIFICNAYKTAKMLLDYFEPEAILKALNNCKSISMLSFVLRNLSVEKYNFDIDKLISAIAFNFSINESLQNFIESYLTLRFNFRIYNEKSYQVVINDIWKCAEENFTIIKNVLEELIEDNLYPDEFTIRNAIFEDYIEVTRFLITNEKTNKSELRQILKYSLFTVSSVEMAQLLISFGIDPKEKNKENETPSQYYLKNVTRNSPLWDVRCFFLKLDSDNDANSNISFITEEVKIRDLIPVQQNDSFEIMYKEQSFKVSNRFFFSLSKIIPMDRSIFKFFLPEEIFLSISQEFPENSFYLTFDLNEKVLLAIHEKQMLPPNETIKFIEGNDNFIVSHYHHGNYYAELSFGKTEYIDHSDHNIEKKYEYRALLSYPVDGLENIKMYPGFMDLNSKNVFYFYDQNVANEYILDNKKAYMTIERLLPRCTFNYTKYLQRLSKIKQIPASISEYLNIDNFIETSVKDDVLANNLRQKIDKFVGDPCAFYNVTSLNSIKVNFRKMLPVGCRVYDLFECLIKLQQQTNSKILDNLSVYSFLGEFITKTFDLENVLTWENYLRIKNNQLESIGC